MYSNAYIFRFASIMVITVATILATAAMMLKPFQEDNIRKEKMKAILAAADIPADASNAIENYNSHIQKELVVNLDGEVVSTVSQEAFEDETQLRAFNIDLKDVIKNVTLFKAGKAENEPQLPVFVMKTDQGKIIYVFPVRGKGLWGPIWGNIALEEDMNTIYGTNFDHKGETPGLGAEINTDAFENQFIGKKIFNEQGEFVSVKVVKGGVANSNIDPAHGVDGISGGTITSNGVDDMIRNGLDSYLPFLKKQR